MAMETNSITANTALLNIPVAHRLMQLLHSHAVSSWSG